MPYDVITFGSALRDVYLQSGKFRRVPVAGFGAQGAECFPFGGKVEIDSVTFDTGGGGANAAATFAQLGFKTAVVSRVGCDGAGMVIRSHLSSLGVDIRFVQEDRRAKSGYSTILLAPSGERTVLIYRGASRMFQAAQVPWQRLRASWFYVSSVGGNLSFVRKVLQRARAVGARVAWNPGGTEIAKGSRLMEPVMRQCFYVQMNREEAAALAHVSSERTELLLRYAASLDIPVFALTDGTKGAYVIADGSVWYAPPVPSTCVNQTGAGDAFGSGFVAGMMRTDDVQYGFQVALLNASSVVSEMGAEHGLLRRWPSQKALRRVRISPYNV